MLINKGLIFGPISRKEELSGGNSGTAKMGADDHPPFMSFSEVMRVFQFPSMRVD